MKQEFLDFLNKLMEANPELTASLMTDNVKDYLDAISEKKEAEKPAITENGRLVLAQMQNLNAKLMKSKDIAETMGLSSRIVSGAMKKLVTDGYVEKFGDSPVLYSITEKGRNFEIPPVTNIEDFI